MYLKGLEMQGFKSFADKISLDFSSGVTAIVGPNGSGKSNISDAVRWVLGEQSAKTLRGSKMEDVIFSGTQKRNPLGFAEVTLLLDNKDKSLALDYEEVAITRKVFASGESQYLINKTPCRLRDIHELFMDTGLGRDGYSMIGQGKIEEILSTKSEDRREIFEEAAGISKYRYRKEEAERKLSRTEENISRVADIILELENQLEPLEKQSEKAKKYLVLKEDLKVYEVNAALTVIGENKGQAEELESKYNAVSAHLESAKREMEKAEAEQEEFYQTAREKEETVRARELEMHDTEAKISMEKSDIEVLANTISGNRQLAERIENEIRELEARILEVQTDILKAEEEKKGFLLQKEEKEAAIKELTAKGDELLSGQEKQNDEIEGLKDAVVASLNLVSELKIKLSNHGIIRQNLKNRKQEVEAELQKRTAGHEELLKKAEELGKECERKLALISDIENRKQTEEQAKDEMLRTVSELKSRLTQLSIELGNKNSRLSMLSAMEQNFEGYHRSVKEVMQAHKEGELKKATIYGPVSKLISSDAKYTLAVEAALGGNMQNIVVETEEDAKLAIEFLKKARGGRATFMPVSAVKAGEIDVSKISREDGYLGVCDELVSCDARFSNIISHLVGRTVVFETMEDAIRVSRKYKQDYRIVTLGGELFNVGGSISGGSANRQASLLGREKEIKQLKIDCTKLDKECEQTEQAIADKEKKAEELELQVLKSEDMLRENKEVLIVIRQEIAHNEELAKDLNEMREHLAAETAEIDRQIADSEKESQQVAEQIKTEEAVVLEKRNEVNRLEQEFEAVMNKKQKISDQIVEITVEKSAIEKDIEVLDNRIADLKRDSTAHRNNADLRLSEKKDITEKNEHFAKEIEEKKQLMADLSQKVEKFRKSIGELLGEKSDFEEKSRAMQARSKELRENVYQLTNDFNRIETKKVKLEVELENTVNRLWDEYELTHSEALAYKKDDLGTQVQVNRRIAELKGKIRELGNVNVDAIEEYKSVRERYEFLSGQRSDLETAKLDLLKIIEEMTHVMRAQFEEKFHQINKFFKKTFVELFGGGTAELTLSDPQNILECGINIDVQPPGKKLQSLLLLSGGERALSAIALLFAILKTRPTPFCFLDEIEAALDDVNVYRFADYVKNYSEDTQFIIVTHRRGTMESADVIYGVTMQEKGVSKLLELNLNEITG
ncbi:MAG: chromosome segregation protein SMC [Clostridia bacterium]|nr:chromosome segregation protein SMC [Clostridia bacterium]